jgi:hypothetical protein
VQGGHLRPTVHQGGEEGLICGQGQAGEIHLQELSIAAGSEGIEDGIGVKTDCMGILVFLDMQKL